MSRNEQLKFHRSFRRCRRFVYNGKIQIITSCIQRLYISSWDNFYFQLSQSLTLCQPQSLNCIIFHTMDNRRQVFFWNHLVQRVRLPSHSPSYMLLKKVAIAHRWEYVIFNRLVFGHFCLRWYWKKCHSKAKTLIFINMAAL
jgi:hypothetical protein